MSNIKIHLTFNMKKYWIFNIKIWRSQYEKGEQGLHQPQFAEPPFLLLVSSWHHRFGNFRKFAIWSGREETQNKRDCHSYSTFNIVNLRDWNDVLELWTISELRSSAERRERWKRWMPLRDPLCSPPIQGVTWRKILLPSFQSPRKITSRELPWNYVTWDKNTLLG